MAWGSGRPVSTDSAFVSVSTAVACHTNGIHFTKVVKTATRMYPKKYIDEVEFQELGDYITLTSTWPMHKGQSKEVFCIDTFPGKPNKRRW